MESDKSLNGIKLLCHVERQ